jgi:hypothetical protein
MGTECFLLGKKMYFSYLGGLSEVFLIFLFLQANADVIPRFRVAPELSWGLVDLNQ